MADKQKRMREVLEDLSKAKGVLGATLVTRDGICILNAQPGIPTPEIFSAMTAALVGAAETAFTQVDGAQVDHISVDAGAHRLIAIGATNEVLLVVLSQTAAPMADVLASSKKAANELRTVMVVA